ncbi:MAG: hypothetical protein IH606_02930 [Burkholderiales bacterium]|nr:hypothetical protein [Burkholderiales bacterium]
MNSAKFLAIGAVIQQLLSFSVILLITHLLGAKSYGEIVTLTAIASTLFAFSATWAQPYIVRTEAICYAKWQKIGSAYFIPSLISFFALLVIIYLITQHFYEDFSGFREFPIAMIILSAIGTFGFQMAKTGLQIQSRFGYYGMMLALDKVILLGIVGGLVSFDLLTNTFVLWAYVAGVMLAGLIGLSICLSKDIDWASGNFLLKDYAKSVLPVSVSVAIHYFSSLTFVIIIGHQIGGSQLAAWIGMGGAVLGLLLQPFTWLAPTLAPKLSNDVLQADGQTRISTYLEDWALPSNLLIFWITVCTLIFVMLTPILPLLLGSGFRGSVTVVALVAILSTAEATNLMLVPIVYAKKLETLVTAAVIVKAIPLLIGYTFGASAELLLILLNLGSWLAIGISLLAIRSYVKPTLALQYAALGISTFLASVMVILPYGKWILCIASIAAALPIIRLCGRMVCIIRTGQAGIKAQSGI